MKTIEELAVEFGVSQLWLNAVKTAKRWAKGKEVSSEEFQKAVEDVKGLVIK